MVTPGTRVRVTAGTHAGRTGIVAGAHLVDLPAPGTVVVRLDTDPWSTPPRQIRPADLEVLT